MRLIFLFLSAIAAALPPAQAQTPLAITSNATLPSSLAGSPASIPIQITGGTQPFSFSLKKGQMLPTGLVLNNSTGLISGTPLRPSTTEIQVWVKDSSVPARSRGKNFILPISGDAPALPTFKVIPSVAQVDKPFSFTLNATRGKTPYTFTTNSTLPAGLSLSTSGTLSGTPLLSAAPQASKDYTIVVRVVGSNAIPQSSTRTYTLTVTPAAPPVITTKTLPDAEMGEEYYFDDLVVTGGKPPYKFKAAAAFPAGLSIAEDGTISGIPKTVGPYRLRISATDANNRTGTAYVSLIVSDAPTPKISTVSPLYWTRNQTVTTTLSATAGRAPYKWARASNSTDPLRNFPAGVTLNQNGTFSGAPTVANTFTVPIRVTDDLGKGSTKTFTIIVSASSLAISSPATLDPAYVGVSPNLNLTAQGGIAPYTWTLKNRGTLPSTITLNSAGRLSGAANATGNFSFTAEVADSRNGTVTKVEKQLTLPVINYNLAISTTSLPAGSAGSNYPVTPLVATGGKPPYTWSFTSTPALSGLSASTGNLTGKPAAAGNYTLALKVTDANSRSVTSNLTLRVNEPDALAFDPLTLPNGRVGTSYNGTLGAKGGFSPYTCTLKTGNALPAGLKLATTGAITGTPSTAGTFKFIVVLKDSKKPTAATIEREFTLMVDAYGMSIDGPATINGKRYSSITPAQFSVTGGTANYTWSATPTLPTTLALDSKTGLVSGDLTAAVGNYMVAIKVTDGNRQSATRNLTVSITQPDPVVWVTPATLPEGQVGGNYTAVEFAASGGRAPYTYALKTGSSLPSGLNLSTAGKISGTPRAAGTFKFTLVASDSQSPTKATVEREFTLVIKPAVPLAITAPNPMPSANVASVYGSASFTASGGLPPYIWSVTPSPAAPGLTFSGGNLTGTPTTAGNYTFTVRVVDSASANATRTITLPVGALIALEWVTPATLPGGQVLTTYNATLTTRGGTAPVTITRISGNLSAGLTQSGARISGTPTAVGNATFTLQARDKNGVTANRTFTLPVAPYDLAVSADSPSSVSGTVNQPFASEPFNADGGQDPYVWSIVGTKPAWLKIDSDSGVLSGTSNATGNFTVLVSVKDGNAQTANKTCTVLIGLGEPPLLDTTQQLPAGMVGVPYPNPTINAEGGLEPYRFALKNGSALPAGLSINATTGVISGTPSAAGNTTTTIVVTGANGVSAERAYTIRIDAYDLAISSEVPWVLQGQVYKDFGPLPLEATGGLESYKWSMTPASTANLTLDASGTLTGRPATAGNFSVTFRVVDARNATVTKNATIQIAPAAPLEFTTEPNLPNGKVATPYGGDVTILPVPTPVAGLTLAGKGGLAPYTYSLKTGSTPPSGLNLSTAGKISGTPSAAGTTKFFVVIKDSKNTTAEREFTLVVEPYGIAVSGPDSGSAAQYSTLTPVQFTATGGTTPYRWSATGLPTTISINATTGLVSGNLTAAPGNYTANITVTDGQSQAASKNFTITSDSLSLTWVTQPLLPAATVATNYTMNLTVSGGRPTYTYVLKNGSVLPAGLTLNATTGVISGLPTSASVGVNLTAGVIVTTLAGSGTAAFADGQGTAASFSAPSKIAVDKSGNIYVSDSWNNRIRKITPSGSVATIAGSGSFGFSDGLGALARFANPNGIAVADSGNIYVADSYNHRIRKITPDGIVTTLAGSGDTGASGMAFSDGLGTAARFAYPIDLCVDENENIYVADMFNGRIRKITPSGNVITLASGLYYPKGVALDYAGNVYVAEEGNSRILKINSDSNITTIAGSGGFGFADGQGTAASFKYPVGIALDQSGNVYVADNENHRIRKINSSGNVTTLAGSGAEGFADGNGPLSNFDNPYGVAVDRTGNIYVADFGNSRIRKISKVWISSYAFTIIARDSANPQNSAEREFTLQINPYGMIVNGPATMSGQQYSAISPTTFTVSGGTANYTWSANSTTGLTINATTGVVSGNLTAAPGNYTLAVMVKDKGNQTATQNVTITVLPAPSLAWVTNPELPSGKVGIAFTANLMVAGGKAPYSYATKNGSEPLPSGLTLDATTGRLSGIPTGAGNYSFTITAKDSGNPITTIERTFTLAVESYGMSVSGPAEISAQQYNPISPVTYSVSGGVSPYSWSALLPAALSINATTGVISGNLTSAAGNYSVAVTVKDKGNQTATQNVTITILPAPSLAWVTNPELPGGKVGMAYSANLTVTGGRVPYTFATKNGSAALPSGLILNSTTGRLSGIPTVAGNYSFTITAKDSANPAGQSERVLTLAVEAYGLVISGPTAIAAIRFQAITPRQFSAIGGTAPYTWSPAFALPLSLQLNSATGLLSGNVTAVAGNYTASIKVVDGNNQSAIQNCTVVVTDLPLSWTTNATLPAARVGVPYVDGNLTATGGKPTYTYSVKAGSSLPGNFTLTSNKITGTPATAGTYTFTLIVKDSQTPQKSEERVFSLVVRSDATDMITVLGGMSAANLNFPGQVVQTFQIGKFEVTWEEWQKVRTYAIPKFYDLTGIGTGTASTHPVTNVNYFDLVKWCNAKSEMEGLTPVYMVNGSVYKTGQRTPSINASANGYRLPSEIEWEWAASGGGLYNGCLYSGSDDLNEVAWNNANSSGPKPVGTKLPNELGIYDMTGNVNEWCDSIIHSKDVYGLNYYAIRGGSYNGGEYHIFARGAGDERARYIALGFRLARGSEN